MQQVGIYVFAAMFIAAGLYHFINPKMYIKIMPAYIPWQKAMVYASGFAEILLGILLLFPSTKIFAAWGLIVLLVAVFPANLQMMHNYKNKHHPLTWVTAVRLPLQIVLIWWAWQYTT